ncbi:MAG: riboflavin synthase [Chloroflexota bacterium]|nr:riboflavin synthase [Chloroflexota bacterium]MDE3194181.1 riboflavin synthase [Chloroflexota bacterium]
MFTGIVEEIGIARHVEETPSGRRIEIGAERVLERLALDDSIAVAGVCLTVVARDDRSFTVDTVPETLSRTTLGAVSRGTRLDLERAATPTTALGGHIVQGHVDGTAALLERRAEGDGARFRFALPPDLARYVVMKGFIALDGVSLTIADVAKGAFDIALIPHTAQRTTLGSLRVGDLVNVEVDIIGKYVEHLLDARERERHR